MKPIEDDLSFLRSWMPRVRERWTLDRTDARCDINCAFTFFHFIEQQKA